MIQMKCIRNLKPRHKAAAILTEDSQEAGTTKFQHKENFALINKNSPTLHLPNISANIDSA